MRYQAMIRRLGTWALAIGLLGSLQMAPAAASDKAASMVVDYATGQILHADDADATRHPASLTKMMTLYMAFEALEQGRLNLNQRLPVSKFASDQSPTKLGLKAGGTVAVRDALMGLVTKSANDAAVVVAEALGGSEGQFARQMTQRARKLGMNRTTFQNASGLPDANQITTARDMVTLGRALIRDFPDFYPWFATRSFTYGGRAHANHNHLMKTYDGMDGIKTGFIRASGFNLVASAQRGNRRLVAAVFGGTSPKNRDDYMAKLLDAGFGTPARSAPAEPLVASAPEKPAPVRTAPVQMASALPPAPPETRSLNVTPVVSRMGAAQVISNQPIEDEGDRVANARLLGTKPVPVKPGAKPVTPAVARPAPQQAAPAPAGKGGWIIQVGSFSSDKAARITADRAKAVVGRGGVLITQGRIGGAHIFRSRLGGFDETGARAACLALQKKQVPCVALGPNSPML